MSQIKPTVGRIVNYFPHVENDRVDPSSGKAQPYPAIITHVWDDSVVNLAVFNDCSFPLKPDALSPMSVSLLGDGVEPTGRCWQWMPFQTGQAAKSDAQTAEFTKQVESLSTHLAKAAELIDTLTDRVIALESKPNATAGDLVAGHPAIDCLAQSVRTIAACEHADVQAKVASLIGPAPTQEAAKVE